MHEQVERMWLRQSLPSDQQPKSMNLFIVDISDSIDRYALSLL